MGACLVSTLRNDKRSEANWEEKGEKEPGYHSSLHSTVSPGTSQPHCPLRWIAEEQLESLVTILDLAYK